MGRWGRAKLGRFQWKECFSQEGIAAEIAEPIFVPGCAAPAAHLLAVANLPVLMTKVPSVHYHVSVRTIMSACAVAPSRVSAAAS